MLFHFHDYITKPISPNYSKRFYSCPYDHKTYIHAHGEKKHKDYRFLLFLMLQQRYQHLLTATVHVIISIILTVNLHTLCRTFTLTHPNTNNYRFVADRRYTVNIRRFLSRSNVILFVMILFYN